MTKRPTAEPPSEHIWACRIGGLTGILPHGIDLQMRQAVERAFKEVTGVEPQFLFSGWGAELDEFERAVINEDEPLPQDEAPK